MSEILGLLFERFTERARLVVVLAQEEALTLRHSHIDTEHILLGLVGENDDVTVRILTALDADADEIRREMLRMLSGPRAREPAPVASGLRDPGDLTIDSAWFEELGMFLDGLTVEIRHQLRREPDTGDLLLALGHGRKRWLDRRYASSE